MPEVLQIALLVLATALSLASASYAAMVHLRSEQTAREAAARVVEETRAEHLLQMQGLVEQAEGLFQSVEQKRRRISASEAKLAQAEGQGQGPVNGPHTRDHELDLVRRRLLGEAV